MKKKITIKGIFNDAFTNYEDKEDSFSFILDDEKDCTCDKERPFFQEKRCLIHYPPENYTVSDLKEE